MARSRLPYDFSRFLNVALAENPLWSDMFNAANSATQAYVVESVEQLSRGHQSTHIRRGDYIDTPQGRGKVFHVPTPVDGVSNVQVEIRDEVISVPRRVLHDRSELIRRAEDLGFDYLSDTLTDQDYAHVVDYLGRFWPTVGRPDYIGFIGFLKNTTLNMERLWNIEHEDDGDQYVYLEPKQPGTISVAAGGEHWGTSHYQITYDFLNGVGLDLKDLINMFYMLSPANYVLHRIVGEVIGEADKLRTVAVPHGILQSGAATLLLDTPSATTNYRLTTGGAHLVLMNSATVILSTEFRR